MHFLYAHGNSLFPGVPIVFCAIDKEPGEALRDWKTPPEWLLDWMCKGTLEAALKLQPQTRQVVLVGGTAETDRWFQQVAQEALRLYEGQIEITFLTDLPID